MSKLSNILSIIAIICTILLVILIAIGGLIYVPLTSKEMIVLSIGLLIYATFQIWILLKSRK